MTARDRQLSSAGTAARAKVRRPGAVAILNLATFGLYSIYWWYAINRELKDLGRSRDTDLGDSAGVSTLAYALGGCLVVPYVWTAVTTNRRIESAQRLVGAAETLKVWIGVSLLVASLLIALGGFGLTGWAFVAMLAAVAALDSVALVYMQASLNTIWCGSREIPEPPADVGPALPQQS